MGETGIVENSEVNTENIAAENIGITLGNVINDKATLENMPEKENAIDQTLQDENISVAQENVGELSESVSYDKDKILDVMAEEHPPKGDVAGQTPQGDNISVAQDEGNTSGSDSESELHATESLWLSDSDNENISPIRGKKSKVNTINESDDEDITKPLKKTRIVPQEVNSGSDDDSTVENITKNKLKELCSSESESENEDISLGSNGEDENDEDGRNTAKTSKLTKKIPVKAAIKEIKDIKSESQRLSRESYIRVPYHKPKQHSLKEFLTRKTIVKRGIAKSANLKMSQEELEEYAKHLDERAKEASEFFKSDSDNEKEESKIESVPVVEKEEAQKEDIISKNETNQECQLDLENKVDSKTSEDIQKDDTHSKQPVELDSETCEELSQFNSNIQELKKSIIIGELCSKPTLKGDPDMLIDLETGDLISKQPSGVDNLLQRFLKTSATKKSKSTDVSILSTENGKIEISYVPVLLNEETEITEHKPGAAHLKLKKDLKKIITDKRKEELMKKSQGDKIIDVKGEKFADEEEDNESDQEIEEEKDIDELEEEMMEVDENEEMLYNEEEEADADDEKGSDGDDENSEDESSESEEEHEIPEKKSKSRIISAFEDSDDDTEKATKEIDDILKEPLTAPDTEKLLWVNAEQKSSEDESELLELCSGQFGATQNKVNISQIPTTQRTQNVDENELYDLCSGTFQEDGKEEVRQQNDLVLTNLESSDDESPNSETIKLKKSRKNKKLVFSDEEDESSEETTKNQEMEDNEEVAENATETDVNEEEPPYTYIDYDSEENEIEVKMNKKDRIEKAEEFFENEAELSESDWGSADEDEKDLDRYDIELGDEEEFDKQKIQSELEKIHLRKMLDDDMREVKKIQELLFEDEENDGVGRERRFRWKHSETGFSLDDDKDDNNENNKSDDEENEEVWRKMRHDRELLLKEKNEKIEDNSIVSDICSSNENIVNTSLKKITVIRTKLNSSKSETTGGVDSPFLISKATATTVRGSFLVRDKATLSKLAAITKASVDADGATGAVKVNVAKTRNFVFATLSDTEKVAVKRKSPDYSRKAELNVQIKKPKLFENVENKKRLIDHLL